MKQNKKSSGSKMTLDKLALMMGNGFNEVHEKINALNKKFTHEIGGLKEKIDEVINTQDKILKDVEDLKDEKVMDMALRDRVKDWA